MQIRHTTEIFNRAIQNKIADTTHWHTNIKNIVLIFFIKSPFINPPILFYAKIGREKYPPYLIQHIFPCCANFTIISCQLPPQKFLRRK